MDQQWLDIIWFVIWALVILAGIGLAVWLTIAIVAARSFKKFDDQIASKTGDPFDTPFFRNHR